MKLSKEQIAKMQAGRAAAKAKRHAAYEDIKRQARDIIDELTDGKAAFGHAFIWGNIVLNGKIYKSDVLGYANGHSDLGDLCKKLEQRMSGLVIYTYANLD